MKKSIVGTVCLILGVIALALVVISFLFTVDAEAQDPLEFLIMVPAGGKSVNITSSVLPSPPPPDMVTVPAGTFLMGCDPGVDPFRCEKFLFTGLEATDEYLHQVYLDEFYIDRYEVTNEEYQACVDAGVCVADPYHIYDPVTANLPAKNMSWHDADTFCGWAGKRLPTEAEWEKAARGAEDARPYPWGSGQASCELANFYPIKIIRVTPPCLDDVAVGGSFPAGASPYGVMDMAGSVWEWVDDWYSDDYYHLSPEVNPGGPVEGRYKIIRGGSWATYEDQIRVSHRYYTNPDAPKLSYGARCAK